MKIRLDQYMADNSLAPSRSMARAMIMGGEVYINGEKALKAGTFVTDGEKIEIKESMPFVSRGGFKLDKALKVFPVSPNGRVCLDIGASTGGFTDCMLQNGALKVYSVDVGYGQLDYKLRCDERVVCMERTNFRYCTADDFPEKPSFASCDVSFISLSLMLAPLSEILADGGEAVCLIKPQFEAGKGKTSKGVVTDPEVHKEAILSAIAAAEKYGFGVRGLDFSPVKGPKGNIEFLVYLKKGEESESYSVDDVVKKAHSELDTKGD